MPDANPDRKLTAAEADQILARAASLDAEGESSTLSAEEIRQSAIAAGIAPHAVERALKEARSPATAATGQPGSVMAQAVQRASATVTDAPKFTSKEIAARLRMIVGADATISEELGTVRARYRDLVVTVMPGATTTVSVASDQGSLVAVTAITLGAGGFVLGVLSAAMIVAAIGVASSMLTFAIGIPGGIGAGLYTWRWHWKRDLVKKAREIEGLAQEVAASLRNP